MESGFEPRQSGSIVLMPYCLSVIFKSFLNGKTYLNSVFWQQIRCVDFPGLHFYLCEGQTPFSIPQLKGRLEYVTFSPVLIPVGVHPFKPCTWDSEQIWFLKSYGFHWFRQSSFSQCQLQKLFTSRDLSPRM